MWMIVSFVPGHTCVRVCNINDYRGLSADLIAQHIIYHIINGPLYKVKEIQTSVKKEFHVDVTYKEACYARRRVIDIVYVDWRHLFHYSQHTYKSSNCPTLRQLLFGTIIH